ncbi:MAG: hypothetical protein LJE68_00615 [Rhodobacter sp.]|jgi:hypothetical protein|nr:hypothetical protein [Rhodobacter sp.]
MTALSEYERLESPGIWRAARAGQRRDVIVSIGDATLVIYDGADRPLAHWSLPAVVRLNPGTRPALFAPAPDAPEELEIADTEMIDAVEKVRKTIERRRPRHGRLRFYLLAGGLAAVIALGVFWLPDSLIRHAASVVPQAKRAELGQHLLGNIRRVAGKPCSTVSGRRALDQLYARLRPDRTGSLVVLASGFADTVHLPGGLILLNRTLVEDYETPDVVAGYVLAETLRADAQDPVERMLQSTGPLSAIRLLTTGEMTDDALNAYAETLMTQPAATLDTDALLAAFREAQVASTPYAFARDISGETTLPLIEADHGGATQVLTDGDWISLQGICGE